MSTMISPTCHHDNRGDVWRPTRCHRCLPTMFGSPRVHLPWFENRESGIGWEWCFMNLDSEPWIYNIISIQVDTKRSFIMTYVLKWHHKHLFLHLQYSPIFPSSKQSPDSLNMPKVTRTTRSSTNSNPNGRVSGNSLENCMASRLVIFSIQTFCHDKPSSNIGVHFGKRGLENGWKVSKVSKVSSFRSSDDPFEASMTTGRYAFYLW